VAGVLLHREERLLVLEKRTVLLGLFFATVCVSALLAVNPADVDQHGGMRAIWMAFERGQLGELAKIVFISMLTTGLVRTPDRARYLLLTIAGSLGLLALKTIVQGIQNPGLVMHGPGGAIADNNDYGLALVMALPLLAFLARDEEAFLTKAILFAMAIACVGGVLLTRSRGGVLALGLLAVAWIFTGRRSPRTLILMPLAIALVLVLTPPELFDRVRALATGTQDASAQNRVIAWEKALNMAADKPVFGVGPGNFVNRWFEYEPATSEGPYVAHNTYLQILAESGILAVAIYVIMIVVTLVSLARLRRQSPEWWRRRYAHAVFLSLLAFIAGSFFLSRTHFDLVYHLVGISVALRVVRPGDEFDWFGLRRPRPLTAPAPAQEGARVG
jgi:probable O-glycosylation ligase (exosortase A-associated)